MPGFLLSEDAKFRAGTGEGRDDMFWQATFFSAANSTMAFYALSLGRPVAAGVCIAASAIGCIFAAMIRRQPSKAWIE